MKKKYKFIALVLALCLLVVPVFRPQRAAAVEPGLITVAGGAIGTGGAAAGFAAGSVVFPVLGVVGAALAAYGINVYLDDVAQESGFTKTQYIYSKLGEFADFAGVDVESMIQGISQNVKVSPTGNILLDAAGGAIISQFVGWLFDSGAIVSSPYGGFIADPIDTSAPYVATGVRGLALLPDVVDLWSTYNNNPFTRFSWEYSTLYNTIQSYFSAGGIDTSNLIFCYKFSQLSLYGIAIRVGATFSPSQMSGSIYGNNIYPSSSGAASTSAFGFLISERSSTSHDISIRPFSEYINFGLLNGHTVYTSNSSYYQTGIGNGLSVVQGESYDQVFVGDDTLWEENKDLLKPGEDEVTVITPPDVLNPAGAAAGAGEYVISAPDYLTAVADAINAAGVADVSISVPVTNTATGAYEAVNVQAAAVDTSSSVAVDSDGFSGTTGLVDPEAEPSAENVIDAMRVDVKLEDVFPFSIPYNFFHLLEKFMATPVAPQWDFDYTFPIGDGYPVHWHMDLTPYESWAVVIRWGVRVGWMATLAGAAQRRIKY